jgi:prolyl oligopeptidase
MMDWRMTCGAAVLTMMLGGLGMAQTQQQQQQSSSHLGSVAHRHGGEEANQNTGNGTNNVVAVPGQHTPEPGSSEVRGGNGVVLTEPPATTKHPVVDTLHGESITDDYRWLEKQRDPETRAWITAQNAYTDEYLKQVTIRPQIQQELEKLMRVETYSTPMKRGDLYFFRKRLANENQQSIYVRRGVGGADERLVDATKLSADQNTSAIILDVTMDGALMAYGLRQGGADEQAVHIMDVASRRDLTDQLPTQRYMGVQVSPDKKGLYYAVFHHDGTLVYWHSFGTNPSADKITRASHWASWT